MQESAENYLETICILSRGGSPVRSVDIAGALEYTKPSVSVAMKNLRAAGHIAVDDDGYITLTASGRKIAEKMYERHILLSDWLIALGVDGETAVNDACRIEHVISEQSFAAIKKHIEG
jgi:Mn-dependent DtxR family transcriptional regulator